MRGCLPRALRQVRRIGSPARQSRPAGHAERISWRFSAAVMILCGCTARVVGDEQRPLPAAEQRAADVESAAGEDVAVSELQVLGRKIRVIEKRMQAFDAADQTRQLQAQVIHQLDELIARLEQASQASQAAGSPVPTSSSGPRSPDDSQQPSPSGVPAAHAANMPAPANGGEEGTSGIAATGGRREILDRAWGHLPAATQKLIRSTRPERFLPKYSRLIEDYYRRLAESPSSDGSAN